MSVEEALKIIAAVTGNPLGSVVRTRADLPKNGTGYIYLVSNGSHILQIGKSNGSTSSRLRSLLPGARPGMHNKSFIVGLAPEAFASPNVITWFRSATPELHENEIHERLGVRTNKDPCVFFSGQMATSIREAQRFIFDAFKSAKREVHDDFSEFELVYQLVQNGVSISRDPRPPAPYYSGDCLNGNVLKRSGHLPLAPIWEKMTNGYFQYSSIYLGETGGERPLPVFTPDPKREADDEKDLLEVDLIVSKAQFESALRFMRNRTSEKDVELYFETSHPRYILQIEHQSTSEKLEEILSDFKQRDELILSNLEATGLAKGGQFFTPWKSAYVRFRKNGFQSKAENYFSFRANPATGD